MKARLLLCAVSLGLSLTLGAQDVASLRCAQTPEGGSAELYGGIESGGFRQGFAASSLWKAGAKAQGVHHGSLTSWYGSFGFEQIEGKQMFTSMLLNPGYYPVDVLEFTPGDKTRQTYSLSGGILTEANEDLLYGGDVRYSATNYAKRKDIRHTTYGMALSFAPTAVVRLGNDKDILALSYVFQKNAETIDAEQVGSATDQSYFAFLDKGMRYGSYQVWDGDGIHLDEAGVGLFPIKEYRNGFVMQISTFPFSGRMEFLWKQGTVGEKGYTWFRYPGLVFSDRISGRHKAGSFTGQWEAGLRMEGDQLEESVLEKVTKDGVTTPVVHTFNKVSHRLYLDTDVSYGMTFHQGGLRSLKATARLTHWEEASYLLYPYEDELALNLFSAQLQARFTAGRFTLDAGGLFGCGGKTEKGLGEIRESAPVQPYRLQGDWDRKMEYMTATRCGASCSLAYHFRSVRGMSLKADGSWLHGFNLALLPGSDCFAASLALGYDF